MQTGQNSIAPANSLPQLGQVRRDSVLMGLTVLRLRPQPTAKPRSPRVVRRRPAQPPANCCPVPQAIACSVTLTRQTTFRNKIPAAGVLRRSVLITAFRRCSGSKFNSGTPPTFGVAVNREWSVRREQDVPAFFGALALIRMPVRQFPIPPAYGRENNPAKCIRYEPIQRLLRVQRHRSSNCPNRGTEFGRRESPS
jgi:hypothetical protein